MNGIRLTLIVILIVGVLILGLCLYFLFARPSQINSIPTNTNNAVVSDTNKVVEIPMKVPWTDTGIFIESGQDLVISATGRGVWKNISKDNPNATPNAYEECDADGTPPNSADYLSNIHLYESREANKGALIGKIGASGKPFKVGKNLSLKADQSGELFLGINDMRQEVDYTSFNDNSGGFQATIGVKKNEPNVSNATLTCRISVPQTNSVGVPCFEVKGGDVLDIEPSGQVKARSDGVWVDPIGETTGYRDTGVDSPFSNNVGGLEMWIGSKSNQHYLIGSKKQFTVPESGTLTFRTIDKLDGFKGQGAFTVVVHKLTSKNTQNQQINKTITVPATVMWYDTGIDIKPNSDVEIRYISGKWSNTNGNGNIWTDGNGSGSWEGVIVPNSPLRSLVAKAGAETYFIGNGFHGKMSVGRLYLSMNDVINTFKDNMGSLEISLTVKE